MFKKLISSVWRSLPVGMRLWTIRLSNPHFTVTAGAVIFNEHNEVLVLKHPFRAGSGWGLPGGFLKAGEQPLEGLQRELREEIGIELENVEILWARSFKRPKQIEILFCGEVKGEIRIQSIEVTEALWCTLDSLPKGLAKDQRRLIERAVEKRKI